MKDAEPGIPATDTSSWLSIRQATEYLEISEQTLYRWMRDGVVTYYKVGDSTRFRREDLDTLIEKHTGVREGSRYRQTCLSCGNREMVQGKIVSTGLVYFKPEKTKFFTLLDSNVNLSAMSCPACGFVQLFSDVDKMRKLNKEKKLSSKEKKM